MVDLLKTEDISGMFISSKEFKGFLELLGVSDDCITAVERSIFSSNSCNFVSEEASEVEGVCG